MPERERDGHEQRKTSCGGRWRLKQFLLHDKAVEAKLTKAEVISLRLYTGPMFVKV
jgi:hypothetical protein